MQSKLSHDPVRRQVDALKRLWGVTAPNVAQRYLDDARKIRKLDRIEFWEEVMTLLAIVPVDNNEVPASL